MKQATKNVLLIRPAHFGFNLETSDSNLFQNQVSFDAKTVLGEFDALVDKLKENNVNVFVFEDTPNPPKPDAIFPNNWVSFHPDGTVVLYPMEAENRRTERRSEIIEKLKENFKIKRILNFSEFETQGKFLEGTGSIVADHDHKINYACLSPRTDKELFEKISEHFGYQAVSFQAVDQDGEKIYHTNVMMCIGSDFSVICLESIKNEAERDFVAKALHNTGKEVVEISFEQMNSFAGNMLSVTTDGDQNLLVLSENAFDSLTGQQKSRLEKFCKLLPVAIPTIEKVGGGSVRCMLAEIFLPQLY